MAITNSSSSALDVIDRRTIGAGVTTAISGRMYLTLFTPQRNFTASAIQMETGTTAFSGLTLCKFCIYTFDETTVTLVAKTASSTSVFAATNTLYSLNLESSYTLQAGVRYGVGFLAVGTTMGSLRSFTSDATLNNLPPRCALMLGTGLTDLPSTATSFFVASSGNQIWARLT